MTFDKMLDNACKDEQFIEYLNQFIDEDVTLVNGGELKENKMVRESLDNVSEVETKSREVVTPAFASAAREIKKNAKKRDEAGRVRKFPKQGEESLPDDLKITLDESLFTEAIEDDMKEVQYIHDAMVELDKATQQFKQAKRKIYELVTDIPLSVIDKVDTAIILLDNEILKKQDYYLNEIQAITHSKESKKNDKWYGLVNHSDMTDTSFALISKDKEKLKEHWEDLILITEGNPDGDTDEDFMTNVVEPKIKELENQEIYFVDTDEMFPYKDYVLNYEEEDGNYYIGTDPIEVLMKASSRF